MYYVYILYSPSSDIYYVGYTDNVSRRLLEHNELSENSFTSKHRSWELKLYLPISESRSSAMQIEKHIKRQKSRKYIESILDRRNIDKLRLQKAGKGTSGLLAIVNIVHVNILFLYFKCLLYKRLGGF